MSNANPEEQTPAAPTDDADLEAATIEQLRADYRERTHP